VSGKRLFWVEKRDKKDRLKVTFEEGIGFPVSKAARRECWGAGEKRTSWKNRARSMKKIKARKHLELRKEGGG